MNKLRAQIKMALDKAGHVIYSHNTSPKGPGKMNIPSEEMIESVISEIRTLKHSHDHAEGHCDYCVLMGEFDKRIRQDPQHKVTKLDDLMSCMMSENLDDRISLALVASGQMSTVVHMWRLAFLIGLQAGRRESFSEEMKSLHLVQ